MAKKQTKKQTEKKVFQNHHVIYGSDKNKEVVRRIRKGVHLAVSWVRKFNYLTDEEISTIKLEAELKRKFNKGELEEESEKEPV